MSVQSVVVVAAIAVLLFFQGGFYGLATCIVGFSLALVIGVLHVVRRFMVRKAKSRAGESSEGGKMRRLLGCEVFPRTDLPLVPLLAVCLVLVYLVSTLVNGITLTSLSETGHWAVVAIVASFAFGLDDRQRKATLDLLAWFGVVSAVFGILITLHVIEYPATLSDGRLQFTFQYANAAGIWFVVASLLCFFSDRKVLRVLTFVPVVALACTMSGGATGAAVVVVAVCAVGYAFKPTTGKTRIVAIAILVAMALFVLVGFALFGERIAAAVDHFAIRYGYDVDALTLLSQAPLLGVGPDNWQFRYQDIQSSQYCVTVVHCAYLQIATDAGVLGLVLIVAIVIVGLYSQVKSLRAASGSDEVRASIRVLAATVALVVHCLVDFDLQFASLAALFMVLLSCGERITVLDKVSSRARLVVNAVSAVLCLALCVTGLWASYSLGELAVCAYNGDRAGVSSRFIDTPFTSQDVVAQNYYVVTLYGNEKYEAAVLYTQAHGINSDEQALATAGSYYCLGKPEQGATVLVERMEAMPYNDGIMQSAYSFFKENGLPDGLVDRYNRAIKAGEAALSQGIAATMPDQRSVMGLYWK